MAGGLKMSPSSVPPSALLAPRRKGSHYKVKHESQTAILTIPAHRPIKPVYIVELVRFVDAVTGAGQ